MNQKCAKLNLSLSSWRRLACLLSFCAAIALPDTGRAGVFYSLPDQLIRHSAIDPDGVDVKLDLILNSEDSAPISAAAWIALVRIVPGPGAIGSIAFDPPDSINNEPNLLPAAVAPFTDFDRDFGGMAYGAATTDGQSITAFAVYVPPTLRPAPALDEFGNLTLPGLAGLASLPLHVAPGTSGTFRLEFDANPQFNGVTYRAAEPNPIRLHAIAGHVTGKLTVELIMPIPGDTNGDGVVDVDDLNNVRNNFGTLGPDDGTLPGDAYPFDGMVDIDDLNGVRNNFGLGAAAVPEPSALAMAMILFFAANARTRRQNVQTVQAF